jgi:hypothetical protein
MIIADRISSVHSLAFGRPSLSLAIMVGRPAVNHPKIASSEEVGPLDSRFAQPKHSGDSPMSGGGLKAFGTSFAPGHLKNFPRRGRSLRGRRRQVIVESYRLFQNNIRTSSVLCFSSRQNLRFL